MSVASFGTEETYRTGKQLFPQDDNDARDTIYCNDTSSQHSSEFHSGRKQAPEGSYRSQIDIQFQVPENPSPVTERAFENSPRMLNRRKNSKFEVGAPKVGQGGFDAQKSRYDYETSQAAAAQMKARQLSGAGNFLSMDH